MIKRIVRPDWMVREGRVRKEVHMMVTPRVVEEVRKHFNCSTLEGAELEDQGGEGIILKLSLKKTFKISIMRCNCRNGFNSLGEESFRERSHDWNTHAKSSLFAHYPRLDGRYRLVQG